MIMDVMYKNLGSGCLICMGVWDKFCYGSIEVFISFGFV